MMKSALKAEASTFIEGQRTVRVICDRTFLSTVEFLDALCEIGLGTDAMQQRPREYLVNLVSDHLVESVLQRGTIKAGGISFTFARTAGTRPAPGWATETSLLHRRETYRIAERNGGGTDAGGTSSAATISVMTWNILAQMYTSGHSGYCPDAALQWKHRKVFVEGCISQVDADVVALQEVDGEQWQSLRSYFLQRHFLVEYHPKAGNGPHSDGVLVALRATLFELIAGPLRTPALTSAGPQVGLALYAIHRPSSQAVIVGCTHLTAAKLKEPERQLQAAAFMQHIRSTFPFEGAAMVLVGDLNSEPRWGTVDKLKSDFGLREVYSEQRDEAFATKQYTCFMPFTQDQLDYIFYSPARLRPVLLHRVPSDLVVVEVHQRDNVGTQYRDGKRFEMLPTPSFPSDHVHLYCVFDVLGAPVNSDSHEVVKTGAGTSGVKPVLFDFSAFLTNDAACDFEVALREMQHGRKIEHWVWSVLPFLLPTGRKFSSNTRAFQVLSSEMALAFLQHPTLSARYEQIISAVHFHLAQWNTVIGKKCLADESAAQELSVVALMGGDIDAEKLYMSLSTFALACRDDMRSTNPSLSSQLVALIMNTLCEVVTNFVFVKRLGKTPACWEHIPAAWQSEQSVRENTAQRLSALTGCMTPQDAERDASAAHRQIILRWSEVVPTVESDTDRQQKVRSDNNSAPAVAQPDSATASNTPQGFNVGTYTTAQPVASYLVPLAVILRWAADDWFTEATTLVEHLFPERLREGEKAALTGSSEAMQLVQEASVKMAAVYGFELKVPAGAPCSCVAHSQERWPVVAAEADRHTHLFRVARFLRLVDRDAMAASLWHRVRQYVVTPGSALTALRRASAAFEEALRDELQPPAAGSVVYSAHDVLRRQQVATHGHGDAAVPSRDVAALVPVETHDEGAGKQRSHDSPLLPTPHQRPAVGTASSFPTTPSTAASSCAAVVIESDGPVSYFERLFGFPETTFSETRKRLAAMAVVSCESRKDACQSEDCVFRYPDSRPPVRAGRFSLPTLEMLRKQVKSDLDGRTSCLNVSSAQAPDTITVQNIVIDAATLHRLEDARGSVIQVASRFNCLEGGGLHCGISQYEHATSQGPPCAVACAAGSAYRKYLVPVSDTRGQCPGQELNGLADVLRVCEVLRNVAVVDGVPAVSRSDLVNLNAALATNRELAAVMESALRIGIQETTTVTGLPTLPGAVVTQTYNAALKIDTFDGCELELWRPFAELVLRASYEATLLVSILNTLRAAQQQAEVTEKRSPNVIDWSNVRPPPTFLTLLGGGAFGNRAEWIFAAILDAVRRVRCYGVPMDIRVAHCGTVPHLLRSLSLQGNTLPTEGQSATVEASDLSAVLELSPSSFTSVRATMVVHHVVFDEYGIMVGQASNALIKACGPELERVITNESKSSLLIPFHSIVTQAYLMSTTWGSICHVRGGQMPLDADGLLEYLRSFYGAVLHTLTSFRDVDSLVLSVVGSHGRSTAAMISIATKMVVDAARHLLKQDIVKHVTICAPEEHILRELHQVIGFNRLR